MKKSWKDNTKRLSSLIGIAGNRFFVSKLENSFFLRQGKTTEAPVTFVIGPPRSGSTLAMQILTDAFPFGYLANRHCSWFGAPALAEYLFRPLDDRPRSDYLSRHGRANGEFAPSECGAWWYRFFRRKPAYVTLGDVTERKMKGFQRSTAALEAASGRPLIFKNLYAGLRLEPIAHYLPNALFVVMERDWLDNAQSILKGRHDALGNYGQWWSVPPPNVDDLSRLPPVRQVVGQIEAIHDLIDHDLERLGLEDRTFRIRYEDLCQDVHAMLERFRDFMANHGVPLDRRFDVPQRFEIDHSIKIPPEMYDELVAYLRALSMTEKRHEPGSHPVPG
uniref:Sulfotransferase family protein n=1 Tax=Candidatus Kentrum sp. FM TaxID=2126340 RepID=A0A450SBJ2_9GAMM|nr:MAG: Sulfotransferase family protein [Candidatus Kentron sp. FM]VFJ49550.1 MAG: Sulfotransferase family protein [Candidatus Kentron sp. FM]VFK07282.1 MAG: Sulfotransferase family protein [Candidatus Kentron sp. FM]